MTLSLGLVSGISKWAFPVVGLEIYFPEEWPDDGTWAFKEPKIIQDKTNPNTCFFIKLRVRSSKNKKKAVF